MPTHAVTVDEERSIIRCRGCGRERPFAAKPLYLISGAPSTGKTGLVERLAGRVDGVAVFDTDLFGGVAHAEWAAWATSWLLVAHGLAVSGISSLLCGYGLHRGNVEILPARKLIGTIHVMNLDLPQEELRDRLMHRPGYDAARIDRKVDTALMLRSQADVNLEIAGMSPDAIATAVDAWLRGLVTR